MARPLPPTQFTALGLRPRHPAPAGRKRSFHDFRGRRESVGTPDWARRRRFEAGRRPRRGGRSGHRPRGINPLLLVWFPLSSLALHPRPATAFQHQRFNHSYSILISLLYSYIYLSPLLLPFPLLSWDSVTRTPFGVLQEVTPPGLGCHHCPIRPLHAFERTRKGYAPS